MSVSSHQRVNNRETPETTYYVYDIVGQRVRRVMEWEASEGVTPTRKLEIIYIGGFEIYREYDTDGQEIKSECKMFKVKYARGKFIVNIKIKTKVGADNVELIQVIRFSLGNRLGSISIKLDETAKLFSYEDLTKQPKWNQRAEEQTGG
ncbi:hypothetical protein TWF481_002631 [Arthrobotrys musiformis]|uniref:Uncharacterized protein n=1 Tax=Arthrobotrys musiformis TaxID=47236 RepID=A0AAV9VRU5_9PEZI